MRQPILIDGRRIYNTTECRKTSIQSYRIRTTLNLITYIAHRYQHHIYTSENPNYLKRPLETRPNTYIGPYISIGDHVTIRNREIENTIVMEGAYIDCGRRITDSLIGRHINILGSDQNLPKEHTQINIPVPSNDATHLTQYKIKTIFYKTTATTAHNTTNTKRRSAVLGRLDDFVRHLLSEMAITHEEQLRTSSQI